MDRKTRNARRMLVLLVFLPSLMAFGGGIQIKEENDYFGIPESDRYYTQGLKLSYVDDPVRSNDRILRYVYGMRNIFYTPSDIAISAPQIKDRLWAGLTAISIATEEMINNEFVVGEWMFGVVGDWSMSDRIQTDFHNLVHCQKPMGWSNQIPHEVAINYSEEHTRCLYVLGSRKGLGTDVALTYCCSLGTIFDYAGAGMMLRIGWKVPKVYKTSPIMPTIEYVADNEMSLYLYAATQKRYVFHNTMLGGSFFQDGPSQELRRWVGDMQAGLALCVAKIHGSGMDLNFSYQLNWRSKEFVGQKHSEAYGTVTLEVSRPF